MSILPTKKGAQTSSFATFQSVFTLRSSAVTAAVSGGCPAASSSPRRETHSEEPMSCTSALRICCLPSPSVTVSC